MGALTPPPPPLRRAPRRSTHNGACHTTQCYTPMWRCTPGPCGPAPATPCHGGFALLHVTGCMLGSAAQLRPALIIEVTPVSAGAPAPGTPPAARAAHAQHQDALATQLHMAQLALGYSQHATTVVDAAGRVVFQNGR